MNKIKSTEVRIIAAFLLVAGLIGFLAFMLKIFALDNVLEMMLHLFAAIFFAVTTYSGFLLLRENEKGLEIGRAVVAIQILNFNIGGLGYSFVTGAYLFFGINNARFGFEFGLDTAFIINLSEESTNFVLRFNLLAIAVFTYLSKILRTIQDEHEAKDEVNRVEQDI